MKEIILAEVSPKSVGGKSLFESSGKITSENVSDFHSELSIIEQAMKELSKLGFRVVRQGMITFTISGPMDLFESILGTKLQKRTKEVFPSPLTPDEKRKTRKSEEEPPEVPKASYWEGSDGTKVFDPPKGLEDLIEGIALVEPPQFFQPEATPPISTRREYHLHVPHDVSLFLGAELPHRMAITGNGIRVAMPDSGFFRHPFYDEMGYRVGVVLAPGASDPEEDSLGHGTGIASNLFAVAPDVKLTIVKMVGNGSEFALHADTGFATAVAQNPDIITTSWGWPMSAKGQPFQKLPDWLAPLEAAIADAVSKGIIVCCAAGNGMIGFPPMHPDVIAVGGTYRSERGELWASSYASSFESRIYLNREVPDVTGLVGMMPDGFYIMMPTQPDSYFDKLCSRDIQWLPSDPGDGTEPDDGWVVASGTSSASPQVAGVCALMLEATRVYVHSIPTRNDELVTYLWDSEREVFSLPPPLARHILERTAIDVTEGHTNSLADGADEAGNGRDLATGYGLANACAACEAVFHMCNPYPFGTEEPRPVSLAEFIREA